MAGLEAGHAMLRGKCSFALAVAAGLDLSIATMAYAGNLCEFEGLAELVEDLGAREWGIDAPCLAGRLSQHPELAISPMQATQAMAHTFGGAYHGSGVGESGQAMAWVACIYAPWPPTAAWLKCGF